MPRNDDTETQETPAQADASAMIADNVAAVATMHRRSEQSVSSHQRAMERLAGHLARPRSLYLVCAFAICWIFYNTFARHFGLVRFDPPPFPWLDLLATLSSLVVATLIYITQNRQASIAEQRDRLDVQINLLSEQKIAKLVSLVEDLRRDLPNVPNRHDPEAEAMREAANPHAVLEELEKTMEAVSKEVEEG